MSIQVSLKDPREPKDPKLSAFDKISPNDLDYGQRRGWWDYVPDPAQSEAHIYPLDTPGPKSNSGHSGAGYRLNVWSYPPSDAHGAMSHRKMSMAINRAPSIAFSAQHQSPYQDQLGARDRAHSPPPPSVMSRLSKYMPRMQLFREVLKNEVDYVLLVEAWSLTSAFVAGLYNISDCLLPNHRSLDDSGCQSTVTNGSHWMDRTKLWVVSLFSVTRHSLCTDT